jgi:ufm1-conjugating enzyme 1
VCVAIYLLLSCSGNEWFTIESNKTGTRWTGKVWYVHELLRYEFDLEFELPVRSGRHSRTPRRHMDPGSPVRQVTYPNVAPELALPELEGKTEKMCAEPAERTH